jgi:hypothetical protein
MTEPDLNALREAARRVRSGQPDSSGGERVRLSTASSETPRQRPLPAQPSTPPVQNAVATPQGGGGLGVFGLVGLLVVGVIIAVALSHTGSQSPGPSPPIVVSPTPPPPPPSPCTQADYYNQALREGEQGLKRFITECSGIGGRFLAQARGAIAVYLYQETLECISRTCNLDQCLQTYRTYMPQGGDINTIEQQGRSAMTRRCNPRPPNPDTQINCPYVGANVGWHCAPGWQCVPAGGCRPPPAPLGQPAPQPHFAPLGRPAIIGVPTPIGR